MKVKIGPYVDWFGPYQLAEALCFWVSSRPDEDGNMRKPDWVHYFGEWLSHGDIKPEADADVWIDPSHGRHETWLHRFLLWIHRKKKRKLYVHIDPWDTVDMDTTLAYVILPMLRQLQATKHGIPDVDDEDVPECLRRAPSVPMEDDREIDCNYEGRWEWVLNEMIFAFERKVNDGCDRTGWSATRLDSQRASNGFRLFGKYYEALWI